MNLDITPDLLNELHQYAQQTRRPAETGLILTDTGWDTDVWTTPAPPAPVAITGEDIDAYLTGDDEEDLEAGELAGWIVESLSIPDPSQGDTYQIADEDGEFAAPRDPDADIRVVTGVLNDIEMEEDWATAWWFDLGQARQIVAERTMALRDGGRAASLWITASGRFVQLTRSRWVTDLPESWAEVSADQAARWVYDADPNLVDHGDDTPDLVHAAVALRHAADAITMPVVPSVDGDFGIRISRADLVEDEAIRVAETARAIGDLARTVLAPHLKATRAAATRIVVEAAGSESGAARRMHISQPTLHNLVN